MSSDATGASNAFRGPPFGLLQAGLDVRFGDVLTLGPFVSGTVGHYSVVVVRRIGGGFDGTGVQGPLPPDEVHLGGGVHTWMVFGLRIANVP